MTVQWTLNAIASVLRSTERSQTVRKGQLVGEGQAGMPVALGWPELTNTGHLWKPGEAKMSPLP